MTNKVLGGGALDGNLGLNPTFADFDIPLGRVVQSIDENGTVFYWLVESTSKGGWLLANGLYANPTKVVGDSLPIIAGSFVDGFTLTKPNQVGIDSNGDEWKYIGNDSLPVVVAPNTDPSASGDFKEVASDYSINNLSVPYIFETVDDFKISGIEFPDGKVIHLNDREADFIKVAGQDGDGYGSISSSLVNQSIKVKELDVVNIVHYGAVDSKTFDSSGAIQAAINAVKESNTIVRSGLSLTHPIFDKGKSLHIPDGFFMHSSSLWFGVDVDAEDLLPEPDYSKVVNKITGSGTLFASCTGKVAWDFTGVFGLNINGPVTFWGDYDNQPRVGMLFARSGSGGSPHNPSAGNHFGTGFRVIGSFSLCNMYNYGSEINHWTNADFLNFSPTGTAVIINTANNARYSVTSDYATVDTTIQSVYADSFVNCTENMARTLPSAGGEGVFILESVAYGPKMIGGYMDTSSAAYVPYFRFVNALGVAGTAAITQSPTLQGVTFESEASPICLIESEVTNLHISGCSMSTAGNTPHIIVSPDGKLVQYDIQAYSGDTTNKPVLYDVNSGGILIRGQLSTIPVISVFLSGYQMNIGNLVQDGQYHDIDINSIAGIPSGAKFVNVKTRVKSNAASDGTTLILRGGADTSVAESFISIPNGLGASQYSEGLVPVVDGKIQYAASAGLTVASLIIKSYLV